MEWSGLEYEECLEKSDSGSGSCVEWNGVRRVLEKSGSGSCVEWTGVCRLFT